MTKNIFRNFFILFGITALLAGFIVQPKVSKASFFFNEECTSPIWAVHFDFPVGKPNGEGYYNAQGFGKNNHLGDDWNGNGGGNTDLGDTIYSVANGYIISAKNHGGGWGNVIIIQHYLVDFTIITSLYAHCSKMLISEKNEFVKRGEPIGTIGTADGIYPAHLHFEMRSDTDLGIGGGYSADTSGYLNPTNFINSHR